MQIPIFFVSLATALQVALIIVQPNDKIIDSVNASSLALITSAGVAIIPHK
jgi:hypothetical protein